MEAGYIKTEIWSDPYFQNLTSNEKLILIYARTNIHTSICGIYKISIKTISFETGIDPAKIGEILKKFSEDNIILYHEDYLCIVDFKESLFKASPQLLIGIENRLKDLDPKILSYFSQNESVKSNIPTPPIDTHSYPMDTHSALPSSLPSSPPTSSPTRGGGEEIIRNLEKWLAEDESVRYPSRLAKKYIDTYSLDIIKRAMKNSSCTSRSKFIELCEFYKNKVVENKFN